LRKSRVKIRSAPSWNTTWTGRRRRAAGRTAAAVDLATRTSREMPRRPASA